MDKVMSLISERPVVIFCKNTCCMSHNVIRLFSDLGVNPTVYELDQMSKGGEIEQVLSRFDLNPTIPVVFMRGKLVGGANEVMSLLLNGSLIHML